MSAQDNNTGHGHVWPRPDGVKVRCGGPNRCYSCSRDAAVAAEIRAKASGCWWREAISMTTAFDVIWEK